MERTSSRIKHGQTSKLRVRRNISNLQHELIDFSLLSNTIRRRGVRSRNSQLTHTLQNRVNLDQRAFSGLHEADPVLSVAHSLLATTNL